MCLLQAPLRQLRVQRYTPRTPCRCPKLSARSGPALHRESDRAARAGGSLRHRSQLPSFRRADDVAVDRAFGSMVRSRGGIVAPGRQRIWFLRDRTGCLNLLRGEQMTGSQPPEPIRKCCTTVLCNARIGLDHHGSGQRKTPQSAGLLHQAAEETRTLDLLHGKQTL